jgi:hypothetical protein
MEWTEENTLGFIELYEKMFVLCDPNHPKYNKLHQHYPNRSSEQLVDHSAQPLCQCAPYCPNLHLGSSRTPSCYVTADCSNLDAALGRAITVVDKNDNTMVLQTKKHMIRQSQLYTYMYILVLLEHIYNIKITAFIAQKCHMFWYFCTYIFVPRRHLCIIPGGLTLRK